MKKIQHNLFLSAVMFLGIMCSCSSESYAPMAKLSECYEEIAVNLQSVGSAFQEVYQAPRDRQEALQLQAQVTSKIMTERNEVLATEAAKIGESLVGTDIECSASPAVGYTVENAVFSTVQAGPKLANIVLTATPSATPSGKPYFLFYDKDGNVVYKTLGHLSEDKVTVNFWITTAKGPEAARTFASVVRIMIVTSEEYASGNVADSAATTATNDDQTISEPEEAAEPEPAYLGGSDNGLTTATTPNGEIRRGANLVETLRQFSNITWDYNADFGVTANVGDYWLVISEDDLTPQGLDVIRAIYSDMENNIAFSIDYIKPSAKVGEFNHN